MEQGTAGIREKVSAFPRSTLHQGLSQRLPPVPAPDLEWEKPVSFTQRALEIEFKRRGLMAYFAGLRGDSGWHISLGWHFSRSGYLVTNKRDKGESIAYEK